MKNDIDSHRAWYHKKKNSFSKYRRLEEIEDKKTEAQI